jgi:hypothetical protein
VKDLCLIFGETTAVLKESNFARNYISNHKETHKNCMGALTREKLEALEIGLQSQQNVFRKQSSDRSSALRASYHFAHLLAKEIKPSCDGKVKVVPVLN